MAKDEDKTWWRIGPPMRMIVWILRDEDVIWWRMALPLGVMVREMRGLLRPYGLRRSRDSVGGSVASAREARVSMMRLTREPHCSPHIPCSMVLVVFLSLLWLRVMIRRMYLHFGLNMVIIVLEV